ncbi:MAG TPA: ATP-binding protein [Ktedonobacteraceae bacterium]|nr:ATP-binding protein [Ktedonobacteraceae bacterium]
MATAFRSEMSQSEHFVQFCETDAFLINSVSEFIGTGLRAGEACIVVATQPHRESLEERLQEDGLEVAAARLQGQYISLDAAAILAQFMVDGEPSPARFTEVFGRIIADAAHGRRRVRIFGEMVALLWADGKRAEAIRLEELWNDLARTHSFALFCAYPMQGFSGEGYEGDFAEICQQHSQVIPAESYTALDDPQARLRAITLLQQKAQSLEAEIAERKRAEESLRLSENRYRRLFEASRDGILIVDPCTGTITDTNSSMTELLGYTHEQLLGQELWHIGLLQDREAALGALRELREKHVLRYETVLLHVIERQRRALEIVCNLYQENGHDVIQCNIRDITERKELEQRKDEFISMASHELKTPVTSLKGFLTLLQRRLTTQGEEKGLHYLVRMDAQVHRLTQLINDLLDLSKMQTGQLVYREERFAVDALVQEIVENVQGTTQTHHLLLEGQAQAELFGDRDRIEQVLINLLNNAIKYSPQADTVLVHVSQNHNQAHVSIQDFGIGIAKEHQHKVFERFYQVTDPEEKTYPGLGIGLYISCQIVRRHGGQLWVESEKGEGATFHMTLPLFQER